jgi:hypothetical protein
MMKPSSPTTPLRPRMIQDASGIEIPAMIRNSVLLTITFAMLALSPLCRAQSQQPGIDSAIEVARADMRAERAKIIGTMMDFSEKDAAAFWPIYRQYEYERSTLEDRRVAVIKEYIEKNASLTDAEAKAMAERMFEYDSLVTELKKRYFKKFNEVLPAFTVTKFFQLDRRIDLLMDMKVESSLPPLTRPQLAAQEN